MTDTQILRGVTTLSFWATDLGAVVYWHVDDVAAMLAKLTAMGAKEYQPLTKWGEAGFITASVVDPFGNILGIMYNPHYLDVLEATRKA